MRDEVSWFQDGYLGQRRIWVRIGQEAIEIAAIALVDPAMGELQYAVLQLPLDFLAGTFAPFFRASESPMAMACLRLVTRPPLPPGPDRRVPCFSRRIALRTLF